VLGTDLVPLVSDASLGVRLPGEDFPPAVSKGQRDSTGEFGVFLSSSDGCLQLTTRVLLFDQIESTA
jgi:hypothetical protein